VTLTVDAIRECLEGVIPSLAATCAPDGTPNATYVSQVHYVDATHIALTYQFFSKTRENVLANPRVTLYLVHPVTLARYRIAARYLRTETAGPLFESMKAKLAGIASHTGMAGVFRLLGSDVYQVLEIESVPGRQRPALPPGRSLLAAVRRAAQRLSSCTDLAALLDEALVTLAAEFAIEHAMVLMFDAPGQRLYTVASRGYESSGVGSEIALGQGVIGVAARESTPIRISHATTEFGYGRAIRASAAAAGMADRLETEIPFPGLPESRSQLAVPISACNRLVGVLYVESPADLRFGYDDEDALVAFAAQLGAGIHVLQVMEGQDETPPAASGRLPVAGAPVVIRRYVANDSIFLGEDYLIKGVAGAIFWKLVRDYVSHQRVDFTNRELRLDPTIRLPDISDNLEARLVLLQRRLDERAASVRIEKTGRGRFRLSVQRPVKLVETAA
jgi:putative methionine-R-sulfoxide reductase with GAF domain